MTPSSSTLGMSLGIGVGSTNGLDDLPKSVRAEAKRLVSQRFAETMIGEKGDLHGARWVDMADARRPAAQSSGCPAEGRLGRTSRAAKKAWRMEISRGLEDGSRQVKSEVPVGSRCCGASRSPSQLEPTCSRLDLLLLKSL